MDLSFSDEDQAFREEVRNFLHEALSDDLRRAAARQTAIFAEFDAIIKWQKILHEKGWVAPAWPKEYGGTGWSVTQRYIFASEATKADAPSLHPNGLGMVGPVIIKFGTEEQKKRYLPKILSAEEVWSQGYSEPGSGSDLASLATRAESDGNDYIINGTKIWTTYAQFSDQMFALVRTDSSGRKQQGITFLLIDMKTPGITIEPIITLGGDHEVNQVFFDDVRVPKAGRIGEEGMGWTYAKYLLEWERGSGSWAPRLAAAVRRLKATTELEWAGGHKLAEDPAFQRNIAALDVEIMSLEHTELRITAALSKGGSPGPEASLLKTRGTEILQQVTELTMEAMGNYAAPFTVHSPPSGNEPPIGPDYAAPAAPHYFNARAASIYAGTNEVQRDIIAKKVLGL